MSEHFNPPIQDPHLGLSVRTTNCLARAGVQDMDDLLSMDEATLMKIPNFGNGCMVEVYRMLSLRGLNLVRRCSTCGQLLPDEDKRANT